ncbi:hypothetical protein DFH09DRAFT_1369613 [Mycena vulgaris]|nr:hypothetical protein DFH09DRAFT_1369613 [Mycena vulgaris]
MRCISIAHPRKPGPRESSGEGALSGLNCSCPDDSADARVQNVLRQMPPWTSTLSSCLVNDVYGACAHAAYMSPHPPILARDAASSSRRCKSHTHPAAVHVHMPSLCRIAGHEDEGALRPRRAPPAPRVRALDLAPPQEEFLTPRSVRVPSRHSFRCARIPPPSFQRPGPRAFPCAPSPPAPLKRIGLDHRHWHAARASRPWAPRTTCAPASRRCAAVERQHTTARVAKRRARRLAPSALGVPISHPRIPRTTSAPPSLQRIGPHDREHPTTTPSRFRIPHPAPAAPASSLSRSAPASRFARSTCASSHSHALRTGSLKPTPRAY